MFVLKMMLNFGKVSGTIFYCHNLWVLVLEIITGGTRYPYIRAGLSRREESVVLKRDTVLM